MGLQSLISKSMPGLYHVHQTMGTEIYWVRVLFFLFVCLIFDYFFVKVFEVGWWVCVPMRKAKEHLWHGVTINDDNMAEYNFLRKKQNKTLGSKLKKTKSLFFHFWLRGLDMATLWFHGSLKNNKVTNTQSIG